MERAFGTPLLRYQAPDGRVFRAPQNEPVVPAALADKLNGIVGLDTARIWRTHLKKRASETVRTNGARPRGGSGPGGGLSPQDIKTAYKLTATTLIGSGQILGLFELDGYRPSDISAYAQQFGLSAPPLQNVLIDGFNGVAGSDSEEVTLDIELIIALASGAKPMIVAVEVALTISIGVALGMLAAGPPERARQQ